MLYLKVDQIPQMRRTCVRGNYAAVFYEARAPHCQVDENGPSLRKLNGEVLFVEGITRQTLPRVFSRAFFKRNTSPAVSIFEDSLDIVRCLARQALNLLEHI